MGDPLISLKRVSKVFRRGSEELRVLEDIDLDIHDNSFVSLMGPSGSGKSTLLYLIAGIERATTGTVEVAGESLSSMTDAGLVDFRARAIGFVFQSYNLIPVLTAAENVAFPLLLTDLDRAERRKRCRAALAAVGVEDRADHLPAQLSGGQEQRVAVARAIVTDPKIIVADEPTGDLDRASADGILDLFETLQQSFGKTIVMVTHDPLAAERAPTCHRLDKGRLAS